MRAHLLFACFLTLTSTGHADAQALLARRLTLDVAWPAPVGHFQPRARDIPAGIPLSPSTEQQEAFDRAIDEKLKICRGC